MLHGNELRSEGERTIPEQKMEATPADTHTERGGAKWVETKGKSWEPKARDQDCDTSA